MAKDPQDASIWNGVFETFNQVPKAEGVFDSTPWVEKQKAKVLELIQSRKSTQSQIPSTAVTRDYPLAAIVAAMLSDKKTLRIVDYGGAMGQTYFDLLAKIPDAENRIDYIIVETKGLSHNIAKELSAFPRLRFTDDYKSVATGADIVHIGSTLQYIDDWRDLLTGLADHLKPEIFILSDLLIGEIPSFVTAQSWYGHVISVRFINIDEFLGYWSKTPYSLTYRAIFQPVEVVDYFPNHALPETHRLKKPCHMVFSKADKP
jgi:putative methyltransferase (TIGR04325 family)